MLCLSIGLGDMFMIAFEKITGFVFNVWRNDIPNFHSVISNAASGGQITAQK